MTEEEASPNRPAIVSREEWETAREKLLVKEKEHTRAGDALAAERRRMPWMSVEKDYRFEGPNGAASLADLFEGRRQLVIYRAHYAPQVTTCAPGGFYPERACMGCSMVAYQVAHPAHLNARDTTLAFVSRAPPGRDPGPEGAPRMGAHPLVHDHRRLRRRLRGRPVAWTQRVHPGGGRIFRTYFIHSRGAEHLGTTWSYLDMTALGRQEDWEESPDRYPRTRSDPPGEWWNYHDAYGAPAARAASEPRSSA